MELQFVLLALTSALLYISVDGMYYRQSRFGMHPNMMQRQQYMMMPQRQQFMPMRQQYMMQRQRGFMPRRSIPRGRYFSNPSIARTPAVLSPMGTGFHDNGLDQLLRHRSRNPMMQKRHNYGILLMFAAEDLGCKTVNDAMGPDFAHYEPSRCSAAQSCAMSGSGRIKMVQAGAVCMCCDPMVTNARIKANAHTRGRERYYEKVNTYDPTEMGGGYSSDMMKDRMQMMGGFSRLMF